MFSDRAGLAILAALALAPAGCTRRDTGSTPRRIAIVAFENLSSDTSLDWAGRGLAEALVLQLTGSRDFQPVFAGSLREAIGASRIVQGYFSVHGDLRIQTVVEEGGRTAASLSAAGRPADLLALARSIALRIDPRARPVGTENAAAFRAYVEGLSAGDPARFAEAVGADPNFGPAYVAWAEVAIARGDRTGAEKAIAAGRAKEGRFAPVERARFDLVAAGVSGDPAARRRALENLARAMPADAAPYRSLGDLDFALSEYRAAASAYQQALARDPDNVAVLNQLGYAQAYAGNRDAAVKALTRYRDLRPGEANPFDSLGDAEFIAGRFIEAGQRYMEAYAKAPSFLAGGDLYKAAWAQALSGDLAGADRTFGRFIVARQTARDPLVVLREAEWEFTTGRRRQAIARAMPLAAGNPIAAAQVSVWLLETGDEARALEYASRAAADDPITAMCRAVSGVAAPGLPENLAPFAAAYRLLFAKDFARAAAAFDKLRGRPAPAFLEPSELLYAWALVETGKAAEAGRALHGFPPPDPVNVRPFLSLTWPRILYVRGAVSGAEGRAADAKAAYSLFLRLTGDMPDTFGDASRARTAVK